MDPVQVRLDELLKGLESQESMIKTLQPTQIPLNEDSQETAWWTTEATEPQRQTDDDAWWNGNDQWTGQGWSQSWNNWSKCVLEQHQANEQSHDCADEQRRRKTF